MSVHAIVPQSPPWPAPASGERDGWAEPTVGSFLDDADMSSRAGAWHLSREQRPTQADAHEAVLAYADLLDALLLLATKAWHPSIRNAANPSPLSEEAEQLLRLLGECARRYPRGEEQRHEGAHPWRSAARSVRIAADILATLRGRDGAWRCPEAVRLDDRVLCQALLATVARLVTVVAACATDVRRQAHSAGVGSAIVRAAVADSGALLWCAQRFQREVEPQPKGLQDLGIARPLVLRGDPGAELSARLARLQRCAWHTSRHPHVGVGTLHAFARIAWALHEFWSRSGLGPSRPGQGTWLLTSRCLADLRTATPADPLVAADGIAVRTMLAHPIEGRLTDRVATIVGSAIDALPAIARWNGAAFGHAVDARQVYLSARCLRGVEVTDRPKLVRAKLAGGVVPAPLVRLSALRSAYAAAAAVPTG